METTLPFCSSSSSSLPAHKQSQCAATDVDDDINDLNDGGAMYS